MEYLIPRAMGFGWHVAEREVCAMAQRQTANGGPDLRLRFARGCASHSLLEIEAWMPSEIKAISPLTDRLMRLIEGRAALPEMSAPLNWRLGKL